MHRLQTDEQLTLQPDHPRKLILLQRPAKAKLRVIDIVSSLGIDVSQWGEFKGGQLRAATNPRFCYEWNFESEEDFIVVNFWTHQFQAEDEKILWRKDLKDFTQTGNATQQARGRRLEAALYRAYREDLAVRVIICEGERRRDGSKSNVRARSLDPEVWTVTSFDTDSNICEVFRGAVPSGASPSGSGDVEANLLGFDGREVFRWFVRHRQREWKLRAAKIESALAGGGSLRCEVPSCGFDFEKSYGDLGKGYAHVHHLQSVSTYPSQGKPTTLDDLAIVCANCHSMIHRGGVSRKLGEIMMAS